MIIKNRKSKYLYDVDNGLLYRLFHDKKRGNKRKLCLNSTKKRVLKERFPNQARKPWSVWPKDTDIHCKFNSTLKRKAFAKAHSQDLKFSAYIEKLVRNDLFPPE